MPFSLPQKHPLARMIFLVPAGKGSCIGVLSTKCVLPTGIRVARPASA
jgi:hypothetical protein